MKTVFALLAGLAIASHVYAQATPTVLASGASAGTPDVLIVDNGTVYWADFFTGEIRSTNKTPGGSVKTYATAMVPGGALVQDNASLYFIAPRVAGGNPIMRMSKVGGLATQLGLASAPNGDLAMGALFGLLYYEGEPRNIPYVPPPGQPNVLLQTTVVAARAAAGGEEAALVWDSRFLGALALQALKDNGFNYAPYGGVAEPSTDSTYLYFAGDGPAGVSSAIWRMPLVGGMAAPFITTSTGISSIRTPTQGAAQGSIFWTEWDPTFTFLRLMRQAPGGQPAMLLDVVTPFFAVDGDKVFVGSAGRLMEVSLATGVSTVLLDASQAHRPWAIGVDTTHIYWSTELSREIMRVERTSLGGPGAGGSAPQITLHPANQTVREGDTVTFNVAATGNPTPTLQWQMSGFGSTFTNLPAGSSYGGTTSATLTITAAPASLNGASFRAVATNALGSATSSAATLTVSTSSTCSYTIGAVAAFFGAGGGAGSVTVLPAPATCKWTATSNADYARITGGAAGTGPGTVHYAIAAYNGGRRYATIRIADKTLTITQDSSDVSGCSYSLSSVSATFPLAGGSGSVTVTPDPQSCIWSAATDAPFLGITSGQTGTGTRTVVYSVSSASAPRSGLLFLAGRPFVVNQTGNNNCTYSLSAPGANFPSGFFGGPTFASGTVTVTASSADCPWTAATNSAFLRIAPGASGTGTGTVTYQVDANLPAVERFSSPARAGSLTIAGRPFVVTQEGTSICSYAILPLTVQTGNAGGSYPIAVARTSSEPACSWTALSHDSWIAVISGEIGSLDGPVLVSVEPNRTGTERKGTVVIAGQTLAITQGAAPAVTVDRAALAFAAVTNGTAFSSKTPPQTVRVVKTGDGAVSWTATATKPWLSVTPASGNGTAVLTVAVAFDASVAAAGNAEGAIMLAFTGASTTGGSVSVKLSVASATAAKSVPFGVVDTPSEMSVLSGSVAVTGWTLDNMGIKRVELWRAVQPGETTPPFAGGPEDPRNGQVFIGDAVFTEGARPDVETLNTGLPLASRAGWGYLLLTQGLWDQGNGVYSIGAYAVDEEENIVRIGGKVVTIDNRNAVKPFGGIDTPTIGGEPGTTPNFGWALTPKVNGAATCKIGPNGVQVSIDSGPLQPVVYGDARSDIAGGFPGFSNSAAAGGHFIFDWSTLSNGPHTIGWLVTDDCGRADGIGSRFFNVTTGTSALRAPEFRLKAETSSSAGFLLTAETTGDGTDSGDVLFSRGYGELPVHVEPDSAGSRTIDLKQGERIELRLPRGYESAWQLVNGQVRRLPIGSTWDPASGTFYWQPAPAFLGTFRLAFSNGGERIDVRVLVAPRGP